MWKSPFFECARRHPSVVEMARAQVPELEFDLGPVGKDEVTCNGGEARAAISRTTVMITPFRQWATPTVQRGPRLQDSRPRSERSVGVSNQHPGPRGTRGAVGQQPRPVRWGSDALPRIR